MNAHVRSLGRFASLLAAMLVLVSACASPVALQPTTAPVVDAAATAAAAAAQANAAATSAAATAAAAQGSNNTGELIPVRLQLQWVVQSQFAGYFAAVDQGFYEDEGLDVTILQGAVDIVPQQVLASGQAEFAIAWVPKALVSRQEGADIVDVGQVFQRSGTLEVSWADSGITKPEDWRGKKVGTWGFGNEFELLAAMTKVGLNPASDLEIVQQPFDMSLLLNREIDAAQAMTYNEYAQVLEATNPDTGQLYQPEDLSVINFNDVGTAMLQDAIWANAAWLAESGNEDVAVRFLRASYRGWIYCRDNFDACVDIVLSNGPTLGRGHMAWQLNEINKLIWPSPDGIGVMNLELWDQTVEVATSQLVINAPPSEGAFRSDLSEQAVAGLAADGVDATGADYTPRTVEITPGGE
ncbi:MAG: ABC transporter substrate-binding protein [Anaerolineales bacterium]|nr:ABC transporter substrate-binding protein [Anaerolineales bacterium]